MSKRQILAYLLEQNTSIPLWEIALSILIAVILSAFMYYTYKKTYTGTVYSQNFNITLVLLSIIVTMVMIIIGSNLALSLGMVGSLSIIRFRTAIKEPKDIAFVFWAIVIGLSCGARIYSVGIIGSLIIALILFLNKSQLNQDMTYLLVFNMSKDANISDIYDMLKKRKIVYHIRMQNIGTEKDEYTLTIRIAKKQQADIFETVRDVPGIYDVNICSYNGEMM
jgi:uncharacterized membrane protein YhiD involved in acid resistance